MTKSFHDAVLALLGEHPEFEHNTSALAEAVGCSESTACRHVVNWRATRHIEWVLDSVVKKVGGCDGCEHEAQCRWLDVQNLPLLCERVTRTDMTLADLDGMLGALEASRHDGCYGQ